MAEFPDYVPPPTEETAVAVKPRRTFTEEKRRDYIKQVDERRAKGDDVAAICEDLGIVPSLYQRWKRTAKGKPDSPSRKPATGGQGGQGRQGKRYTDAQKKKILDRFDKLIEKGRQVSKAAVDVGVNLNTIRTWQGYVPPSRQPSTSGTRYKRYTLDEQREFLGQYVDLPNAAAAQKIGCAPDTVRKWRKRHGVHAPTPVRGLLLPAPRRVEGPTDGSIRPAPPMPAEGLIGRMVALEAEVAELRALILG